MISNKSDSVRIVANVVDDLVAFEISLPVSLGVVAKAQQILIPLVARMHHLVRELKRGRIAQTVAVSVDWLVRPISSQSELSPTPQILLRPAGKLWMPRGANPTASPLRTEDAIELGHAYLGQRIRLVHHDHHVVLPPNYIVGASENSDPGRRIPFQPLIRQVVVEAGFMCDADVSLPEIDARDGVRCGLQVVLHG